MAKDYTFTRESVRKVIQMVLHNERLPSNRVQPWRANKVCLGAPGILKWGLSSPTPATVGGMRIESQPDESIDYYAAGGTYATVQTLSTVIPYTWYPLIPVGDSADGKRIIAEESTLLGIYGRLVSFSTEGELELEDGYGAGTRFRALEPGNGSLPPPLVGLNAYGVRTSTYSPGNTPLVSDYYTLILQPCGGP